MRRLAVLAVTSLILGLFSVATGRPFGEQSKVASAAGAPTTLGRKFSFIFPPNLDAEVMRVYVSSSRAGTGTWSVGSGAATNFSFSADTAITITIPNGTQLGESGLATGTITGKRVVVTTNVDASVYADSNATYTSDATASCPRSTGAVPAASTSWQSRHLRL
jgi:hypothetical protein